MHHPKKWGGALVIFWDALGMLWLTLETLQDAPGRSGTLRGRFGGHSGGLCGHFGDGWMMLMMVVAMVMAMAKIFAFRFYMSKLPINRVHGEGRRMSYYRRGQSLPFFFCHGRCLEDQTTSHIRSWKPRDGKKLAKQNTGNRTRRTRKGGRRATRNLALDRPTSV